MTLKEFLENNIGLRINKEDKETIRCMDYDLKYWYPDNDVEDETFDVEEVEFNHRNKTIKLS